MRASVFGFLFYLLAAPAAWAYPELVRHGYVNCTSCHVSPTGGGTLTQYGRELSKEVLSTWGREGEQRFAYGLVPTPEWLLGGGDYRHLYLYQDTPFTREGRPIFMQADIEAAALVGQFTADASIGYQDDGQAQGFADHLISRRHYVAYRPTDELSFRAGKFLYAFGLNLPDHTATVRRGLGIDDQNFETYNLEAAWIGEKWNFFATGILGRPDSPALGREQGASLIASTAFQDRFKVGLSYLYGTSDSGRRNVVGPWGILGFTPHFFLLTEWDAQFLRPSNAADSQYGAANYNRLDYEILQGLHIYATQEFIRKDFADPMSVSDAYGVGAQFFPRPHFELNLTWQKRLIPFLSPDRVDYAWLLLHYYL